MSASVSCAAKPAIRPDSKRTPVVSIDASSARESHDRCSSLSSTSTPSVLRSSSATTRPRPSDSHGRSVSGSMVRSDALESRVARSATVLGAAPVLVSVIVVMAMSSCSVIATIVRSDNQ